MNQTQPLTPALDYRSDTYRDAYSRINAIVLEGEREAHANYLALAELLPDHAEPLRKLAAMENRHFKGFQSCARNLEVTPDEAFARTYFEELDSNFQKAAAAGDITTCMVIQALIIECFAISAYNVYIPVADPFARKVTEGVVKDEYLHLNFGQQWLKEHFAEVRPGIERANAQNMPIIWRMLSEVEEDTRALQMDKEAIVEDFLIAYGEALADIGFSTRDVMKMSAAALASPAPDAMFGLIGHLTNLSHAQRVARELGYDEYASHDLEFWCMAPPQAVDEITITSATGQVIYGQYVESCFLPEMLTQGRFKTAVRKVLNAMALVQKRGIDITALGGFSSIIFENFNLEKLLNVRDITLDIRRFTTGNTHTAYILAQQVEQGAAHHGIDLEKATVAVVGATGDIGSAVCRWLTTRSRLGKLLLVARDPDRLNQLQSDLGTGEIVSVDQALPRADVVVWVASMSQGMAIDVDSLRTPCLLIDGGYPKNMAVALRRTGVHVLDGGMVEHSLDIDWKIMQYLNVPNPARQFFACFAESMLLEFEGLHCNFSWGRNHITVEKMEQIGSLSRKHGFRPLLDLSHRDLAPPVA